MLPTETETNDFMTTQFSGALESINNLAYLKVWENMLSTRKEELQKGEANSLLERLRALLEEIDGAGFDVIYEGCAVTDFMREIGVELKESRE